MFARIAAGVATGCTGVKLYEVLAGRNDVQDISGITIPTQQQQRFTTTHAATPSYEKEYQRLGKKRELYVEEDEAASQRSPDEDRKAKEAKQIKEGEADLKHMISMREERLKVVLAQDKKIEAAARAEGIELKSAKERQEAATLLKKKIDEEEKARKQKEAENFDSLDWKQRRRIVESENSPVDAKLSRKEDRVVAEGEDFSNTTAKSMTKEQEATSKADIARAKEKLQDLEVGKDSVSESEVTPVQMVIIGGGLAAGRIAALMDSIVDVTLIDTKNFAQFNPDIVPLFASPWSNTHEEKFNKCAYLHRYYLKRANVLTSQAIRVDAADQVVHLKDGRCVPYDALFFATGKRRAFPFSTEARTKTQRKTELQYFNNFLTDACKRVAVVGGGPLGVSVAGQLASARPDLEVVLYHNKPALLTSLPQSCRTFTDAAFRKCSNLIIEKESEVVDVQRIRRKPGVQKDLAIYPTDYKVIEDDLDRKESSDSNSALARYSPSLVPRPAATPNVAEKDSNNEGDAEVVTGSSSSSGESAGGFFSQLFGGSSKKKENLHESSQSQQESASQVVQRQWEDQFRREESDAKAVDAARDRRQQQIEKELGKTADGEKSKSNLSTSPTACAAGLDDQFVLSVQRSEGGEVKTHSILHQWYFRSRSDQVNSGVAGHVDTTAPFDYVFNCVDGTPYHEQFAEQDPVLRPHLSPDGKFKASRAFQLMGQPHMFALGSAAHMPWEDSYVHAVMNVRYLFTQLYQCWTRTASREQASLINAQGSKPEVYLTTPRYTIDIGNLLYVGVNESGVPCNGITGAQAFQDQRRDLLSSLLTPKRFKPNPPGKVRAIFDQWRRQEVTDVSDFEFQWRKNTTTVPG